MAIVNALRSSRFRRLSNESFWIVFGQALSMLGMLVGVRVMTELLDPAAFGDLALAMTIALFVNQCILGPLGQGVVRLYAPAVEQADLGGYWDAARRLAVWASCCIGVVALALSAVLLASGQERWASMVIAVLFLSIVLGYNSILNGLQNAARQRKTVAIHQGMLTWVRFLLAAAVISLFGATSRNAIVGYVLAGILVLGSQARQLRNIISSGAVGARENEQLWRRRIVQYSWPFCAWGIFSWAQMAADRWALELCVSTRDVGLYSVLFQMGYQPMSIATGMAVQFIAPVVFQRAGDATDAARNERAGRLTSLLTLLALVLTGVAVLAGWLLHPLIFQLLVADEFREVSHLLPWVLLSGGLFAAAQTRSLYVMGLMNTRALLPVKIGTASLGVSLSFGGAYLYGVPGTVAAGVLFSLSYLIWVWILSSKQGVAGRA